MAAAEGGSEAGQVGQAGQEGDNTWRRSRARLNTISRTFSNDTTSSSTTWYLGTGTGLYRPSAHEEDPPVHFEKTLCTRSFLLKFTEWVITIVCLGFFSEARIVLNTDEQISFLKVFPIVTYWSYITITGIIILSYLLGQKMREMLIRMFNIIGGVMLLIVATAIFINWDFYNRLTPTEENPKMGPQGAKMLLTQGVLSLINACVYFIDTAHSLYISYKSITANTAERESNT